MRFSLILIYIFFHLSSGAQDVNPYHDEPAKRWADSVYNTLTPDERLGQLMVVRLSSIDFKKNLITFYDEKIDSLIRIYNIGGICLFQGSPVKQASLINHFQSIAKTPILMCIDAENGLGMRILDSVLPLPRQMMLGAMNKGDLVYEYGRVVAEQCKRLGVQVNYAPVVDVNNNPDNPVINDRSFGENVEKVSNFGIRYMQGLQDRGVMACAKHFPGHGDVNVDSHVDLPVINKSRAQLDSLELVPFKKIFAAGVGSAMIAHLYIPSIDARKNRPTSISYNNVTQLLRNDLGYDGLTFTDALDMKGVAKYFPNGEASVEALIAGNDMLCLPEDIPLAIRRINVAINQGKLNWADLEMHCKKVLAAKYRYGLDTIKPVLYENLAADLNRDIPELTRKIARQAITLLSKQDGEYFPFQNSGNKKTAIVGLGVMTETPFITGIKKISNGDVYFLDYTAGDTGFTALINKLNGYDRVILSYHNMSRSPTSNFGLSKNAILLPSLLKTRSRLIVLFGNAYAVKNFCDEKNLVVCYEDGIVIQQTAIELFTGQYPFQGSLPVRVCEKYPAGSGIVTAFKKNVPRDQFGFDLSMPQKIDSIVEDGIAKKAMPGCTILVAKNGKLAFQKSYGNYTYLPGSTRVNPYTVYDLASLTKMLSTTLAVMKLYDQGKIDLKKKISEYLPEFEGSNKSGISIEKLLLHEGGLIAYIPFYKETLSVDGKPLNTLYRETASDSFPTQVARNLYLRKDWQDTILSRIISSPVGPEKYVYSDNDFIILGRIVEKITGVSLAQYVKKNFFDPLSLESMRFLPLLYFDSSRIAPTEDEKIFRTQLISGYVHDPGAALSGGVSGHAGLFADAYDVAVLMQLLLNKGEMGDRHFISAETIEYFTSYHSSKSRRGYGFDKPEKDNAQRAEPYPAASASSATFGHTGFTGTCAWADPENQLVFIFLSNRVYPDASTTFNRLNIRGKIMELVYQSLPQVK
jgi:beta-glucosidase-like glycosyl hydrolase/CubicO group peptidase (beta-lactamase class C family)